jgi:amino acid transporter
MAKENQKMSFNASWSMAVGGMVGGGIFSVIGVIIAYSGQWAWLSFLLAGLIALVSAHSYSQLSLKYNEGGGAFTFLRKINHQGFAGSLSWILILGYILTLSVYAFTFGHYVAHAFGFGAWLPRILAVVVIASFTMINLKGVGNSSRVEIITVYGKILVLFGLAAYGLIDWSPEKLSEGITPKAWHTAIVGAATIFMAYEGFQLLAYDYEDLKNPDKTLPRATFWAVLSVIILYLLVTFGTTMITGAQALVEQKEVALAMAGQKAFGTTGLIIVTIAAAFSTGSAINATLFSTARLMESVAQKKDLPHLFVKENNAHIPIYALVSISVFSTVLALLGSLESLVDAASIIFLFTFGTVNWIAYKQKVKYKWLCLIAAIACLFAIIGDSVVIFDRTPYAIVGLIAICAAIMIFRPIILKKVLD